MKTAQEYPVSFPYGATTSPYSPKNPHGGNDRACPVGTPVVIAGVTIGLTGATGNVTGPHLHTQAGNNMICKPTFNPTPLEFKPGAVVNRRLTDSGEWGRFVTIQVGSQFITYCHLSEVRVNVGDIIKENNMACQSNANYITDAFNAAIGRLPTPADLAYHNGRPHDVVLHELMASDGRKNYLKEQKAKDLEIASLKKQLAEEGIELKPGKYVVK